MLRLLSFFELTFFFLSNVAALNINVQANTIAGQPSLVIWTREPSDGDGLLVFDLRFVKPENETEDIGLALANIEAPPSTDFGTVQVVFPSPRSYLLVAVNATPDCTRIGRSGEVNAIQVPTISASGSIPTTPTSQPVPSTTSSASLKSTAAGARRNENLGAIIGGTLGGVAFLGLLASLGIVLLRRQPPENRRWTFYQDKMIRPPVLNIRRVSTRQLPTHRTTNSILRVPTRRMTEASVYSQFSSRENIDSEQQRLPQDDILSRFPIVVMRSPTKPRIAYPRPRPLPERPEPLRPLPPPPDQEVQRRNKMATLENNNDPGPTQHISTSNDSQKKINWM